MEVVGRIVFGIVGIVVLILLLWISLYLFLALMLVGGGVMVFFLLRNYLTEKGILNPTPGMPVAEAQETDGPVIEGNYERIESTRDGT